MSKALAHTNRLSYAIATTRGKVKAAASQAKKALPTVTLERRTRISRPVRRITVSFGWPW